MLIMEETTKAVTRHHICDHHKARPNDTTFAGCTCSSEYLGRVVKDHAPSGQTDFDLLGGSSDPEKLKTALRFLLDASKPYLRRKKMTPRNDCAILNAVHEECEKLLAT